MRANDFVLDYVQLLYYNFHKINLNCGGSYIDSTNWIKNKKSKINSIIKKDNKSFQYAVFNYKEIKQDLQRITMIKSFIKKYNWEGINYSPEKDDWKKLRKLMQQLLLMFFILKRKNISCLYFKT